MVYGITVDHSYFIYVHICVLAFGAFNLIVYLCCMKGQYFISNITGEIHNLKDVKHNLIEHETFTEVEVLSPTDEIIDACVVHDDLVKLIAIIFK